MIYNHIKKIEPEILGDKLHDKYILPLALMAYTYIMDLMYGWSDNTLETFDLASKAVDKALKLNTSLDTVHSVYGFLLLFMQKHDKAIEAGERAVALNPSGAHAHVILAYIYWMSGKSREAVSLLPYKHQEDIDRYIKALRKAGLPD